MFLPAIKEACEGKLIYLATPYSHADTRVVEHRFNLACCLGAILIKEGLHVFCPIAHTHHMASYGLPLTDSVFWVEQDRVLLERCDVLVIAKVDGWGKSKGVAMEFEIAREKGIPILFWEQHLEAIKDGDTEADLLSRVVEEQGNSGPCKGAP